MIHRRFLWTAVGWLICATTGVTAIAQGHHGHDWKRVARDLNLDAVERLFLFHPAKKIPATPKHIGLEFEDVTLVASDKVKVNAWWVPVSNARATLLLSHGNAGNIGYRLEKLKVLNRLGLNVLMYDYRGFGKSEGTPDENGLYADAQAAYEFLLNEKKIRAGRVISYGESLGGSVAAVLASRNQVGALVLDSSFSSAQAMAAVMLPWLRRLTVSEFDTRAALPNVAAPVLILHSAADEVVPYSQAKANFEAANDPKQFVDLKGDHNRGFIASGRLFTDALDKFLDAHFASQAGSP